MVVFGCARPFFSCFVFGFHSQLLFTVFWCRSCCFFFCHRFVAPRTRRTDDTSVECHFLWSVCLPICDEPAIHACGVVQYLGSVQTKKFQTLEKCKKNISCWHTYKYHEPALRSHSIVVSINSKASLFNQKQGSIDHHQSSIIILSSLLLSPILVCVQFYLLTVPLKYNTKTSREIKEVVVV